MKTLAVLLFASLACGAAFGQQEEDAKAPATAPAEDRNGPQPEKEHREPRAFTVTWDAPRELRTLFDKFIPPPKPEGAGDSAAPMRP